MSKINPDDLAELDYASTRAAEVQKLFYGLGLRKHAAAIAYIVECEIRDAIIHALKGEEKNDEQN